MRGCLGHSYPGSGSCLGLWGDLGCAMAVQGTEGIRYGLAGMVLHGPKGQAAGRISAGSVLLASLPHCQACHKIAGLDRSQIHS